MHLYICRERIENIQSGWIRTHHGWKLRKLAMDPVEFNRWFLESQAGFSSNQTYTFREKRIVRFQQLKKSWDGVSSSENGPQRHGWLKSDGTSQWMMTGPYDLVNLHFLCLSPNYKWVITGGSESNTSNWWDQEKRHQLQRDVFFMNHF